MYTNDRPDNETIADAVMSPQLEGVRVLYLEDEALINMSTTEVLEQMGCSVRSFMQLDKCFTAIEIELPDVGVLDVNIDGEMSFGLAAKLNEAGVPILFVTGYDTPDPHGHLRRHAVCRKPCSPSELEAALIKLIAGFT